MFSCVEPPNSHVCCSSRPIPERSFAPGVRGDVHAVERHPPRIKSVMYYGAQVLEQAGLTRNATLTFNVLSRVMAVIAVG